MKKMFSIMGLLLALFVGSSCSQKGTANTGKEELPEIDPSYPSWMFKGFQIKKGSEPMNMTITFVYGINAEVYYNTNKSRELKRALWKMVDNIVYIYPTNSASLYIKGVIIDEKHLEVSWESLGTLWDTQWEENEWKNSMVLELVSVTDMNDLWTPWSIPGFTGYSDKPVPPVVE